MLAPLLFLWPISIIVTHNVADNIANRPYDLALADSVRALARLVSVVEGQVEVDFPAPPRALFRSDQDDTVYYQVAREGGGLITGDAQINWINPPSRLFPSRSTIAMISSMASRCASPTSSSATRKTTGCRWCWYR